MGQIGIGLHAAGERHYIPSVDPYYRALGAFAVELQKACFPNIFIPRSRQDLPDALPDLLPGEGLLQEQSTGMSEPVGHQFVSGVARDVDHPQP